MRRIKLELCYDGADYSGWQIQPKQPQVKTIQGELQRAIARVVGAEVEVLGSGRTDAGVHALCQVAAFNAETALPTNTLVKAINAFLPPSIRVWRAFDVPLDFHPIRDVVRKRYRYLMSDSRPAYPFLRRNAWTILQRLDLNVMREAAKFLLGTHDFAAFQTQGSPRKTTVRTVYDVSIVGAPLDACFAFPKLAEYETRLEDVRTGVPEQPALIAFEIEADGFLYNMVRAIVGTLKLFGERHNGFEDPETMRAIVERADRRLAGPTAPAHGLYMIDVVYPEDARARGLGVDERSPEDLTQQGRA
ncbi:MAG: tRNA pseudouridine(38-40) synthase TruA [Thermoguttaceae bacterium]|nr:tRNA pseudouridine(38-40) synthase TruA [Thermoguttaceae bacterium]